MCQPDDQAYMPIDRTWGIMPLSGRCPSILNFVFYFFSHILA